MFMLEQVVGELLNLVISVYHLATVSLDRASVLFPTCHFSTCHSIIKKYMWSRLPIKVRSSRKHSPRQGAAELSLPQPESGSHKIMLHVVERSSELEK
jgi:hypothetical protein